jgi:hypothetical protein
MKVVGAIGRGIAYVLTMAARAIGGMGGAKNVNPETYRTLLPSRRDDYRP